MKIDTDNIVSLSEANRNFSRVARLADEVGTVVILRNNAPSYLLIEYSQAEKEQVTAGEDVAEIARRIVDKSKEEFRTANTKLRTNQKAVAHKRDTEQIIREVNATMAMEGMPLTDEDKERLRDIFNGSTTVESTVQSLVQKHKAIEKPAYERV